MKKRKSADMKKLVDTLLKQKDKPDMIQKCPNCSGKLHVKFEIYASKGRKLGIQLWCEDCGIAMAMDRKTPLPTWICSP